MTNKTKKRILIFVPNGATTDNRVVREAESMKRAGYECLLVGLRLKNLPGSNALTAQGVKVQRIDWQYKAFSKIAIIYAVTLLPVFLLFMAALTYMIGWAYFNLLLPLADGVLNLLFGLAHPILKLVFSGMAAAPVYTAEMMKTNNQVLYHIIALVFLLIFLKFAQRIIGRMMARKNSIIAGLVKVPFLGTIIKKARFARNYGENENVKNFTVLETLLSGNFSPIRVFHETVVTRVIFHQRQKGFFEVGMDFVPDIIQCHEVATLPAAISLKDKLGCRVIYEAHEIYDDLANASPTQSKHYRTIHETNLPNVDAFITVNPMLGKYYEDTYPKLPTPVILPNSVYPKTVEYDGRLHKAAKLPEGAKIALYQGGFSPHRGMEILLEAAYHLPEDWYVVFMGRGPLEEDLREAAKDFERIAINKIKQRLVAQNVLVHDQSMSLNAALSHSVDDADKSGATTVSVQLEDYLNAKSLEAIDFGVGDEDEVNAEGLPLLERRIRHLRNIEQTLATEKIIAQEISEINVSGALRKARFVPMAPHSELVEWTSGGTIGVIPYQNVGLNHWNCSPNKIWEFPNAGLPIIGSRLNFLSQMINKWNIGWTISSDPNFMDIVSTIRAITDDDLAVKRQACKDFIAQDNYTIHEKRLLDTVHSLL